MISSTSEKDCRIEDEQEEEERADEVDTKLLDEIQLALLDRTDLLRLL